MKKLYTSLFLLFFSASLFSQTTYVMGAASGVNGATANALNGTISISNTLGKLHSHYLRSCSIGTRI
jgi:hypothetical protein